MYEYVYVPRMHVREDSVIGSPFNVNWSLLFVFTFVIALYFFVFFDFLILFVCVVFKVQHLRISILAFHFPNLCYN